VIQARTRFIFPPELHSSFPASRHTASLEIPVSCNGAPTPKILRAAVLPTIISIPKSFKLIPSKIPSQSLTSKKLRDG
jgi:hypothetical protein